ncbi:hypothetical protein IscW_ISCW004994 [Ixodes scapularis]|uniref:Uncharacterized protein n=1 Tax=Ixodes scapularis TaxID=6945 RepID=B7PFW7_IXOSC|nr:hypothetical protein IscW_ISCW004994 [Ixodes scapularis]|eukprot:XP_002434089.1 hypothetical protein IscW_ISCW004994 [Ixodes scapularis]
MESKATTERAAGVNWAVRGRSPAGAGGPAGEEVVAGSGKRRVTTEGQVPLNSPRQRAHRREPTRRPDGDGAPSRGQGEMGTKLRRRSHQSTTLRGTAGPAKKSEDKNVDAQSPPWLLRGKHRRGPRSEFVHEEYELVEKDSESASFGAGIAP